MAREHLELVSLDAGGVLVLPHQLLLSRTLRWAGVSHDRDEFGRAHYLAMAAVDAARSAPEDFPDYLDAFLDALSVPHGRDRSAGRAALDEVFGPPLWCQPVPGSRRGLEALAASGVRLAVTSNSDGTVAEQLERFEVVQPGPGPATAVEAIVDSGTVGVAKPDPAIFAVTAERTGVPPERILHVGDSVHFDVEAAVAAGARGVHFDPHGICEDPSHPHVRSLAALVADVAG